MYDAIKKGAAAVGAAAVMLSAAAAPVRAASDEKLRVMCLGDSITDGFWMTGGYRNTLCSKITEAGFADQVDFVGPQWGINTADSYDPNHAGYSGYSIADIAQEDSISGARTGITGFAEWLLGEYPADVVFLQIGTNDILSLYDLDHFGERLEVLVDIILAALPDNGMLYLATLPVMDATNNLYISDYFFTVESMDAAVESCNAQIRALYQKKQAAGAQIRLANINGVLTKADLYDGVHPSAEGYAKMGAFWYERLCEYRSGSTEPGTTVTTAETTTTTTETTTTETTAPPAVLPGDVDGNGRLAVADAVLLQKHLTADQALSAEQASRADLDGNARLTAVDLTLLKRAF